MPRPGVRAGNSMQWPARRIEADEPPPPLSAVSSLRVSLRAVPGDLAEQATEVQYT